MSRFREQTFGSKCSKLWVLDLVANVFGDLFRSLGGIQADQCLDLPIVFVTQSENYPS